MQNLPQGSDIWIVAGVAFILGFLVEWLIARSRKNALIQEYEKQLQTAQRTLKRTQDDLETVRGQLDEQRERAEVLAAERANAQSELELANESRSGSAQRVSDLESALGQEVERREAVEELLEQVRSQAMEFQTALDDSRSELTDMGTRLSEVSEARSAAETALEAEGLRVSRLAQELEALSGDLAAAQAEMEAAVAMQQAASHVATSGYPTPSPDQSSSEQGEDDASSKVKEVESPIDVVGEEIVEQSSTDNAARDDAALEAAQLRVYELSASVNALSAMGAEVALEFEKRDRENQALRAKLASLAVKPDLKAERLASDQAYDQQSQLTAIQGELNAARAQNSELEHQLAALQRDAEQSAVNQEVRAEDLTADVAAAAEDYQHLAADLAGATARAGELDEQLVAQAGAFSVMSMELTAAREQVENLLAQVDRLQREHDALVSQNTGMEARLNDRTEEVHALTSATVAAAATLKRRDDALQRSEALIESLQTQIAVTEEEAADAVVALAEKDAQIAKDQERMAAFQTELTTLGEAKAKAEARYVETEAAFAATRAEKQADIDAMQTRLQELTQEVERTKAQPDSRDERAAPHSALMQSASAGDAEPGNSSVKAAAIRNALLAGVAPGEIERPQDLERLPGIGPIYERRLYAAGIGTFWEFASCPDEDLLEALGLEGAHEVRVTASKARTEAYRLAEKTETVGMLWGGRQADGA